MSGLDPRSFDPSSYAADVVEYNALATEGIKQLPWPPKSAQAFRDMIPAMAAAQSPGGRLYAFPDAETLRIPVAGGEITGRVFRPEAPTGLYVHLHGGGWTVGASNLQDAALERIMNETGQAVVSVEYRMAPEHPFPVPVDDCEAATRWLIARAQEQFGTTLVTLGGESAGANLSLAVALRLQREPTDHPIRALNLLYGAYDLSMTPTARSWDRGGVLTMEVLAWFYDQYAPDHDRRRDPQLSPLYADLRGLPRTLVTVGTEDILLDDSLFLYARLVAARIEVELHVVPGAGHSFDAAPTSATELSNARVDQFLRAAVHDAYDLSR